APEDDGEGEAEGTDYLACAVSDEGSWTDQSFNQAAYAGLTQAEDELGIEIADAESNSPEDFDTNLQQMVDQDCDVIFGVGFNLETAIFDAADSNPDSNFVWIDGYNAGQDNLKPITYKM